MNKNNTMKKTVLLSVIVSAIALSGCSASYKKPVPQGDIATSTLVDQKMIELGTSIDRSLNDLVKIERGDAPRRNLTNPIGTSIAGRPESKPLKPINVDSKFADGQSKASVAKVEERLDTKVNIAWHDDDAAKLLTDLSNRIGFTFNQIGTGLPLNVTVKAKNETIKSILGVIAVQIEGRADIKVDLPKKTIQLIRS